ncbi:hypothetical protein ORJ04_03270 [Rheinheimera baltica]|uniref:Orphan protein n=1 Tax=Rheinheimera baltica TaxID=67576 RepID=A0ABT9HV30_9GAMM|nr:hypothetical protein [Rheinheimera baltica]MDP5134966.1 hypothetical protein [Rheinheimera baltica]
MQNRTSKEQQLQHILEQQFFAMQKNQYSEQKQAFLLMQCKQQSELSQNSFQSISVAHQFAVAQLLQRIAADSADVVVPQEVTPEFHADYALLSASNLFDARFYLMQYPDIQTSALDPLWHFIKFGGLERRKASAYFDTAYYLEQYEDVAQSGINPLIHFLKYGLREGRRCVDSA